MKQERDEGREGGREEGRKEGRKEGITDVLQGINDSQGRLGYNY